MLLINRTEQSGISSQNTEVIQSLYARRLLYFKYTVNCAISRGTTLLASTSTTYWIFGNALEGPESQTDAQDKAEMIRVYDQDGFHQAR